ncbi:radical SAM protein [Clostridium folliculivorans]|uniref:Radical SAM protein n=1 Tax=Clostridium folliculivorans TaxID=2886038 RepID=A0A9W5Y4W8_9CLOT|nr:radical SAM protein [Clostridium folliculivorans]GKU26635.1 radical SAM protein [Clostridium folliculivorans]GKU28933.1 radical SAM protein [Clostridium folliculivorans]
MQPKTKVHYDEKSLEVLKRTIKNISDPLRNRKNNPCYATELPEVVGIKLTNRCNLRCKHCYEWNEKGFHRNMDKQEQQTDIALDTLKKVLEETKKVKSRLYLWGGEPLVYKHFEELTDLLLNDPREVAMCTNALLIPEKLDSIIKLSDNLELLVPVEGFEEDNDLIRGEGNFKKTMESLNILLDLKKKCIYKGKISIHTVINDSVIPKLYDLVEFFEKMGVDMLMLCYPWYIAEETACNMDNYFNENFSWIEENKKDKSWHSFTYKVSPESIEILKQQIEKINSKVWDIRVRFQPDLDMKDVDDFILGTEVENLQKRSCLAVSTRMDIYPDGAVSSCKFFSEFTIGNLNNASVSEIWHSEEYNKVREIISSKLTPVCSKCNLLHLHGN